VIIEAVLLVDLLLESIDSHQKNKKNEESVEGLMSKITDQWDNEILGRIQIPLPHIPDIHTTPPVFHWNAL
jgi:hypothetical protein